MNVVSAGCEISPAFVALLAKVYRSKDDRQQGFSSKDGRKLVAEWLDGRLIIQTP